MTARVHLDPAGFGILIPSSWQLHTNISGLALAAILPDQDGTRDNVGVVVEDTGEPTPTLERYMALAVALAPRQIADFRVQARSTRTTADAVQGLVDYTGRVHGHPRHFLAVTVLGERRAFTATYTATEATYDSRLSIATPVLRSLFVR